MKLAPYATASGGTYGRIHQESHEEREDRFATDRIRVVHSSAFRRLEYKTQVLVNHVGDHYRTRLTHSLEVSQIARTIARRLHLNEDLAEVIALAHDLGHPPFGHAGEDGLKAAAEKHGGFDHNLHGVKIVTGLEDGYFHFKGLNLSGETLEGIIKHNGPLKKSGTIAADVLQSFNIPLDSHPSLEAQVAALADDIAYCNHDLDDAIRAKFITVAEVMTIPQVGEVFLQVKMEHPHINNAKLVKEAIRRLSALMVNDLVENSRKIIVAKNIKSLEDVFSAGSDVIRFSAEYEGIKNSLKKFLFEKYYRHYLINRMTSKAMHVVQAMFDKFYESPDCLPSKWYKKCKRAGKAEVIIDYIAGMTDRYAIEEYNNLFDPKLF